MDQALLDTLPDLFVLVRRDGVILECRGGSGVAGLKLDAGCIGQPCERFWPAAAAKLLTGLARRAITQRAPAEGSLEDGGRRYELRAHPVGPDRALCTLRPVLVSAESTDGTDVHRQPQLDRRGFMRRYRDAMARATLSESAMALAIIHVDGIEDIAQAVDASMAERIMSAAIARLAMLPAQMGTAGGSWSLGQLSEHLLALILESSEREDIEARIASICAGLKDPVKIGDAEFHLTPYAGVAILGRDATTPKALFDQARMAAGEAKRRGSDRVCFFSDTQRLRSLARLDITRELRDAIAARDIRLRYVGRHELSSGRLVAWVGYLRWQHAMRGDVRPTEFLRMADSTGLTAALSRVVMQTLNEDFAKLAAPFADVRISFGALRHHLLHPDFVADIEQFLRQGVMPASRVELRIAERTFSACDPSVLVQLRRLGVHLVVDEIGRGIASLNALARAPIGGLQLDRAWVTALPEDPVALKVCRAAIAIAQGLGITPYATGVDSERQRDALLQLGCQHGSGDLYASGSSDTGPIAAEFDRSVM